MRHQQPEVVLSYLSIDARSFRSRPGCLRTRRTVGVPKAASSLAGCAPASSAPLHRLLAQKVQRASGDNGSLRLFCRKQSAHRPNTGLPMTLSRKRGYDSMVNKTFYQRSCSPVHLSSDRAMKTTFRPAILRNPCKIAYRQPCLEKNQRASILSTAHTLKDFKTRRCFDGAKGRCGPTCPLRRRFRRHRNVSPNGITTTCLGQSASSMRSMCCKWRCGTAVLAEFVIKRPMFNQEDRLTFEVHRPFTHPRPNIREGCQPDRCIEEAESTRSSTAQLTAKPSNQLLPRFKQRRVKNWTWTIISRS